VVRPAVRIICLDARASVLLLLWRSPVDARELWEPPGGGIDPGESPFEAARRELAEETGLDPASIVDSPIVVQRDNVWNGKRFVGPESFFLARYPEQIEPPVSRAGLLPYEAQTLLEHAWVSRAHLAELSRPVVPLSIAAEIARLAPEWAEP
jgi:8-oxo-dGTP pyrophosphatase MutT (NUDIX family)